MMKKSIFSFYKILLVAVLLFGFGKVSAQISESFESGLPASYNSTLTNVTLGSGTWQIKDVLAGMTGFKTGSKSAQLRSATGSQIITPNITTGVGVVTFWGSASTTSGSVQVNYSTDGGTSWTPATGSPFSLTTGTTVQKTATINSSAANILVQFYRTAATVYIDDVNITSFTSGKTSNGTGGGDWNTGSTWNGGSVPSASDNVTILASDVVSTTTALTRNATTTVNGSFQLNSGGWVDDASGTIPLVYGSNGTLIFNAAYNANNGNYWPTTDGPVNVTVNASSNLDLGFARTVTGLFQTSSKINNPGNITIGPSGTFQLNGGYNFSGTGSPTYGASSLLKYNSGGTPPRSAEWSTATSGAGYPANVQISNGSTFDMGSSSSAQCSGNLLIDASATLNVTSGGLTVLGNVTTNGTIFLGGDVTAQGNWTVGSIGSQLNNGKAVFFTKSIGNQVITKTGSGDVFFDYLIINKAAGDVQFSASPATSVVINTATIGGRFLQLINAGNLDLNGQNLTLNNDNADIYVDAAGRNITSGVAGAKIIINGNKYVTGSGTLNINANVTTILNKGFDFGTGKTTVNGTLQLNSGGTALNSSAPIYANGSTLLFNSAGNYDLHNGSAESAGWFRNVASIGIAQAGVPWNVTISNNTSVRYNSANNDVFPRYINGNLLINPGSTFTLGGLSGTAGDFFIRGNWTNSGTFIPNSRLVSFNGTTTQTLTGATTFDYLTVNNTSGVILASPITNSLTLDFTSGKLTLGANDLTIGSGGAITNATSSKYVVTNGTGQLKRTVGAADALFAVGNSAYNPITFNNTGGTSDVYGVRVADGALTTAVDNSKTVTRKWIVSEAVSGGSNLKVVAQYNNGEEDTNFIAGTAQKIGFYDGTNWTDVDAVKAGSNPYTFTSNTNISPTTLSGTQYLALGKDNAFRTTPTKYVITAITPSSPGATYPFTVTVQAQDAFGFAANLTSNSTFALTTNGNAGTIGGTVTGTILSGTNSIVVNGVTLATAGTGVTVTATRTAGLTLTSGTSSPFTVLAKATKLAFVGVPATGSVSANLSSFTVEARRPDNTVDTFYTGNITIAKASGSGTLSGTLTTAAVAGIATFSDAQFNAADTYAITTTASGITSDTSGNIVITVSSFVNGDYRTNPSFGGSSLLFSSTTASGGIYPWQKWNGSNWIDVTGSSATAAPENLVTKPDNIYLNFSYVNLAGGASYNNIIVEGGYLYSGNTSVGLTLNANKTLDIKAGYVKIDGKLVMNAGSNIYVRTDSEFELGSSSFNFIRNATSNLNVEDAGYLYIDNYLANVWTGNENFAGESYVGVYGWDRTQKLFDTATDITNNSTGSKFGYLDIDLGTSGISDNWTYVFPSSGTYRLTNHDFYLTNSTSNNVTLNPATMEVGGDFIIYGTGNVSAQSQAGTKTINVKGNFIKNGTGQYTSTNSGTSYVSTLNVDGDFIVNAGIFSLDIGITTASTSIVNLKGNLSKASGAFMLNTNANSSTNAFNFTGTSPQTVDLTVGASNDMLGYYFNIKNGAYVTPLNQDWKLATNSKLNVESGGTLDFSFKGSVPLNVITNGSQVGMTFNAQSGSILKITSPDGLNTSAPRSALGNVQIPVAGRTFDPGAIYHYIGKSSTQQVTGNGIAVTTPVTIPLTGKIIVDMENGSGQFAATSERTISSPGTLEIIKGVVTDDSSNSFIGSGNVKMESADGRYITSKTGPQPSLKGTYSLTDGVVEFANSQTTKATIRVTPEYYNIDVSGSNVESGGQNLMVKKTTTITPSGYLTIPTTADNAASNVLWSKKGIVVSNSGTALFGSGAQLMQDVDAVNGGNITMQRNTKMQKMDYTYWSSPVSGQVLKNTLNGDLETSSGGFSPTTPNTRIFDYVEATDLFKATADANFVEGKGYAIRGKNAFVVTGPDTYQFLGQPTNGSSKNNTNPLTIKIYKSKKSFVGGIEYEHGFNMIGNPYPSNIDFYKFYDLNKPIINAKAWFWTNVSPHLTMEGSNYNGNNYATVTLTGGAPPTSYDPYPSTGGYKPTNFIKVGQGFIVQAKADVTGPTQEFTLNFNNDIRDTGIGVFYNNPNKTEGVNRFWVRLRSPLDIVNTILIGHFGNATDGYDNDYDAELLTVGDDSFYTVLSNKKLQIQAVGVFNENDIFPVSTKSSMAGSYTFEIEDPEGLFASGQPVYLHDKLTGTYTNLNQENYSYQAVKGFTENRFEITYKTDSVLSIGDNTKDELQVYRNGEDFIVQSRKGSIDQVEVFDASGRLFQKVKGGTTKVVVDGKTLVNGMYILKIKRKSDLVSKKIMK